MYAATRGPNVKWESTYFKWGGRAPLAPAGDGPAFTTAKTLAGPQKSSTGRLGHMLAAGWTLLD